MIRRYRQRPLSSSSMLSTCAAALLITLVAALASEIVGPNRSAIARERAADGAVLDALRKIGWTTPRSPALREIAAALHRDRRVTLLHADAPFVIDLPNGEISAQPPDESDALKASVIVADELSLLPRSFIENIGLWRVVLCAHLSEDGIAIPSLPNYRRTLIIDVADASPSYLRRLVQHEVFHFFDLADDGVVLADEAWATLNEAGFKYGNGGRSMRNPGATTVTDTRGFVTGYATSSIEEDKAEVFAFAMTAPAVLIGRDKIVAKKTVRIKELLAAFEPQLDALFWRRLEALRRR